MIQMIRISLLPRKSYLLLVSFHFVVFYISICYSGFGFEAISGQGNRG